MSETNGRVQRHREIREIVRRESIGSQDDLARALGRRGIPVTQATLSRDLRELRILRMPTDAGFRYAEAGEEAEPRDGAEARRLRSVATLEVVGVDGNETCVVVRTLPGRAPGVAVWIDSLDVPDMLATVAGDDTILVLPKSTRRTSRLRAALTTALDQPP